MNIGEIACRKVKTLNFIEPVARALYIMQEEGIRHLPVLRNRVPDGMVSDHNILSHLGWHDAAHKNAAVNDRVEKIMRHPIVTVSPDETIEKVAQLIINRNIGAIPLVDSTGRLVGIATKSDFLKCFLTDTPVVTADQKDQNVASVMSKNVLSVTPDDATLDALHIMKSKRIQHLPVLKDATLVGILSDRDILRGSSPKQDARQSHLRSAGSPLHVRGLMCEEVLTLPRHATLSQAAGAMVERHIGAIPIVSDDNRLEGIITETDMIKIIAGPLADSSRVFQF